MSLAVEDLEASGVHTVIVTAPDVQGRLMGRRVTTRRFLDIAERGLEVATCVFGWDLAQNPDLLMDGSLPYTGMHNGMGDVRLVPDLDTLRPAGWLDRVAVCLADAVELDDGALTSVAPRTILRHELARLSAAGMTARVGTELEFYLWHGTPGRLRRDGYRELDPTTRSPADFSIREADAYEPFFQDLRARLDRSGIELEASQIEWGLGQWEITLAHADPLEMADRHVLYKLAVRDLAAQADMTASFMARPQADQPGSSCHVHLSVHERERARFHDPRGEAHASEDLHHAIGGILAHTPELLAWYAPTVNSYRRIGSQEAAGWGLTWGYDNRSTSIRVLGHSPATSRLEFRLAGADTNPYLTLAALLASVRDGVEGRTPPGDPERGNAYERPATGLPEHLGEAVARFRTSAFAATTFGEDVVHHYATLGEFEWRQFLSVVTDWERERYLEGI